ncbi:MAG TPA: hypothetical protein VMZ31_13565 [Phycisphaerae bacterium]|nr:hypothetical protein [Phycisphaerae bacterium]
MTGKRHMGSVTAGLRRAIPSRAPAERARPQPVGDVLMFWVLLLMAGATFAACILVPIAQQHERLLEQEELMRAEYARLDGELAQTQQAIAAIRSDPAVNEQLAKTVLNYRRPGERRVTVVPETSVGTGGLTGAALSKSGTSITPWWRAALDWLPQVAWKRVFAEPNTRAVLLVLSAAMVAAAFWLYGRSVDTSRN